MTQGFRLPEGGMIDRQKKVNFTFDGQTYSGYEGDTLASALLANGVHLMGRSFKYHRPRGCISADSHEPNAIVELRSGARREPNTRATMAELYESLEAKSQNAWPSLKFDYLSFNQLLSPFLTAGFYYKTFMWPASFWEPIYEKFIRNAAGLGRAATQSDPDSYEHAHAHCDVLIVGGGPSGISAALSAGKTGARVILVEENYFLGGQLTLGHDQIDKKPALQWLEKSEKKLAAMKNVTVMPRTVLFGYYDHNVLVALERVNDHVAVPQNHEPRQRMWTIRAKEVVIACGSQERPLLFDNNDKPGVMLSSAVRRYVDRFAVIPGHNVAICTNNDDGYKTANVLRANGIRVAVICDARKTASAVAQAAAKSGLPVELGIIPAKAHGRHRVSSLSMQRIDGSPYGSINCDCVAVSGGHSADVHLVSQTGVMPIWNAEIQSFIPGTPTRKERSAGASAGNFALFDCLKEGTEAGYEAAKSAGIKTGKMEAAAKAEETEFGPIFSVWRCPGDGKAFVDFQNDVSAKDITLAEQEGYVSVEHAKRYTTLGMATDQGKTSNVNGLAILAQARGQSIPDVGTTRFRPPYSPVAIGAFAGHERGKTFQPIRRTAMHGCHEKMGAVFVEAGQWVRPQYYPKPGEEIMAAIWRESDQVRKTAGMCDVSTLGKIEIFGSDSAEFLNRLYINGWKLLAPGKARYGLMLREDGYVFDDGTTSRLADDHFFMTTTTANAARVLAHMEYHSQVVWPELDVHFCSATEQWCGVAVAGPNSRKILDAAFAGAQDVSDEALPFMGVREFMWHGAKARIFRISFSGELAYEVNVPWRYGTAMWNAIWEAGQEHGLIPYGTEALSVLRIEKGHVAGNELDGRTTAADMGLGKMMSTKKEFIGNRMAHREGMVDPDRAQLVGIKIAQGEGRLRGGAHLIEHRSDTNTVSNPSASKGWVTSVGDSPQLGCWIGLAYLQGGASRHGTKMIAHYPLKDEQVEVEIVSPHFFDPKGERLHG
ncbi:MAG: sarcosine oxidase subunit alpha family protein [Pseudomonadota bacterium]